MGNCEATEPKAKEISIPGRLSRLNGASNANARMNSSLNGKGKDERTPVEMGQTVNITPDLNGISLYSKSISPSKREMPKEAIQRKSRVNGNKTSNGLSPQKEKSNSIENIFGGESNLRGTRNKSRGGLIAANNPIQINSTNNNLRDTRSNLHQESLKRSNDRSITPDRQFTVFQNNTPTNQPQRQISYSPVMIPQRSISPIMVRNISPVPINSSLSRSFAGNQTIIQQNGLNNSLNKMNYQVQNQNIRRSPSPIQSHAYPNGMNNFNMPQMHSNSFAGFTTMNNGMNYSPMRQNNITSSPMSYRQIMKSNGKAPYSYEVNEYIKNIGNISGSKQNSNSFNGTMNLSKKAIQKISTNFENEKYILTLKCTGDINKDAQVLQDILKVIPPDVHPQINEKDKMLTFTLKKKDFEGSGCFSCREF